MQYSFTLDFCLQGQPTQELLQFANKDGANLVLATHTLGGNLTSNIHNFHQLTIRIPLLKKHVTFSSSDSVDHIRRNMVLYNLACSLGSCTLVHFFNQETNQLMIQIITDAKWHYDLLKSISQRFEKKSQ